MLIGYARVSKADGSQSLDLQHDALRAAGVEPGNIYDDRASGSRDDRPGLAACLKSLRDGDVLIVWKLDRSEEHTSELQSLMRISYAVFCLKKKPQNTEEHEKISHIS